MVLIIVITTVGSTVCSLRPCRSCRFEPESGHFSFAPAEARTGYERRTSILNSRRFLVRLLPALRSGTRGGRDRGALGRTRVYTTGCDVVPALSWSARRLLPERLQAPSPAVGWTEVVFDGFNKTQERANSTFKRPHPAKSHRPPAASLAPMRRARNHRPRISQPT